MIEPKLKDALSHVNPVWDDVRTEAVLSGLHAKRRRRNVARAAAAGCAVLLGAATILFIFADSRKTGSNIVPQTVAESPKATEKAPSTSTGALFLADGSFAAPVDDSSRVVIQEVRDDFISVRVEKGRCDFEVVHRPERMFQVQAGAVTATVLGTVFSVGLKGDRTLVAVSSGHVRVEWPGGEAELSDGMEGVFPLVGRGALDAGRVEPDGTQEKAAREPKHDWRRFTREGEYDKAVKALYSADDVHDTVEDLLLAADAMRLAGYPEKALPYLEQVVERHRFDPRAPLAEFTRGRVLLLQLGMPRDAAEAFRSARRLAPSGTLAQDALAREVEAWHMAGESDLARQTALEYTERYPSGRRVRAVRRFGGLD
jgi:hypothetical protein